MRKRAILTVAAWSALVGCGSNGITYGGGGGGTQGGHTTSIAVGPGSATVFSPAVDTVSSGATITWTWGSGPHTVTFETLNDSSAAQTAGATFQALFSTPGTYRYRCMIHSTAFGSGMSGTIVVQ